MRCPRCKHELPAAKADGWVNCPKCKLPVFRQPVKPVKAKKTVEKETMTKEEKESQEPSEVEEIEEEVEGSD